VSESGLAERFAGELKAIANLPKAAKRLVLLAVDTFLIIVSLWAAVALRLEDLWPLLWHEFFWLFFALPVLSLPVFITLGLYRAIIRYSGIDALGAICKAVCASFLILVSLLLIHGTQGFPRSVPLLYLPLVFLSIGGSRLFFRIIYACHLRPRKKPKKVLIYGAGSSGLQMANAFRNSAEFKAVGFVDDRKDMQGRKLNGTIIHPSLRLPELVAEQKIDLVLLAMPSVSRKRKQEILNLLSPLPVDVKTLPSLDVLVSREAGLGDIREIEIEDLLGREPVPPRMDLIHSCIMEKNVLVTGAGGSIGSELCRQVAEYGARRLILFEQNEYALYAIDAELRRSFGERLEVIPVLGSVTHKRRIAAVLKSFAVHTVYHAAAYKHVPLVEYNPIEGVRNNLFGTLRAAEAALEAGVETFVFISTDKAVRPTNVMGASKRMAELVLQAFADVGGATRFTMVRFGNVLGSSGSVVPLFREQIRKGGPVTVTHPEVVRYFMTIPEAVQLVLQAGAMGEGGDVFVLDMGEPVRIVDLARKMIRLCGCTVRDQRNPDGDISIHFCGLRPGEKLFEELLVGGNVVGTEHPMIMRAEEAFIPWPTLGNTLATLDEKCHLFDHEQVRTILLQTVEGYNPQCPIADSIWIRYGKAEASACNIYKISKPLDGKSVKGTAN
jgi:FlaA1/EpsC-like NDP-sugar epimerase